MIKNFKQFINEQKISEGSYGDQPWASDGADDVVQDLVAQRFDDVEKELSKLNKNYKEDYAVMEISEIVAGIYKWATYSKEDIEDSNDGYIDNPFSGTFEDLPKSLQKAAKDGLYLVLSNPDLLGEVLDIDKYMQYFKRDISKIIK